MEYNLLCNGKEETRKPKVGEYFGLMINGFVPVIPDIKEELNHRGTTIIYDYTLAEDKKDLFFIKQQPILIKEDAPHPVFPTIFKYLGNNLAKELLSGIVVRIQLKKEFDELAEMASVEEFQKVYDEMREYSLAIVLKKEEFYLLDAKFKMFYRDITAGREEELRNRFLELSAEAKKCFDQTLFEEVASLQAAAYTENLIYDMEKKELKMKNN